MQMSLTGRRSCRRPEGRPQRDPSDLVLMRPDAHDSGGSRRRSGGGRDARRRRSRPRRRLRGERDVVERRQQTQGLVLCLRASEGHLRRHDTLAFGDEHALGADAVSVATPALVSSHWDPVPVVPAPGALWTSQSRRVRLGVPGRRSPSAVGVAGLVRRGRVVMVVMVMSIHGDS